MRDLVIYFRNSTSILMWEMGNQAQGLSKTASHDLIASIDGLSFPYESTDVIPYSRVLYEIVNQFDYGNRSDIRANIGTHATSTPSSDRLIAIRRADNVRTILDYVDVVEITEGGASSITSKPLIEGEYNRLEVRRGVWDNYTPGYENFKNVSSSPDYVNVTNESYALSQITKYNTVYNNTHYVGGANWIFSDTISHGRVNSEVARATGEVDAVMLEKPSYYANQVLFAKNPQVYIVGHWNYEAGTIKPVYVIGKNVASVELLVNGISLGNGVLTDEYIFKFNNVVYGAGTITAKGKNIAGEVIAEYSITTHGEPTKLKITPIVGPSGLRATGNDILLLDVEVLDANNNRCLTFDGVRDNITTTFTVNEGIAENTAVWLGGYNSSIPELTRTNTLKIENGITRVSLRTTRTSGTIKVKAETPNLTSAEITTTSSELMNTFGYTATMEPKTTYDLTSLTPTTYGTGAHLGQEGENEIPSTLLLSNFMYTGTTNANNGIYDALQVGSRAYSDSSVTFSSIPYAYLNAEYLRIPSIDTSPSLGVDLINIAAKRSIDVLIFYDANYEIPTWMVNEGFIPTGKTVTASDGTSYAVYSISITPGTLTTLGSNGNINAKMYIVAVKETDQIENIIFYYDKFNYIDDYAIKNGYNRKIEPIANANVSINNTVTLSTVEKGTGNVTQTGENVLQFNSNGEGEIAYIQKQFAAQTGRFSVSFDALVRKMDYPSYNTYIRVWFGSDYISHENDKDKLKVESYLTRLNDSVLLTQRSTTQNSAINTVYTGTNNIDKLVNYCYEFDMEARNYNIYIDNTLVTTTPINFIVNSNTDNFIDTIIIGTSKGTRADFYIDNLKIMPEVANVISGIKIDGNLIPSFDSLVNNYEVSYPIGTNSNIELITEELFDSYTVEYKKNEDKLYIRVIDSYGNTLTYVISSSIVTRLEGKTIHEEENTSIEVATIDGVEAIHFSDESDLNSTPASKFAYLSREFSDMTNKFTVKFDAYVSSTPTDTTANTWLRTWLSDGPMLINPLSEEEKKNLAVQLYLHKNTNGTFDLMGRESGSTASNNMYVVKNMSLDSWHKFSYEIDVPHHCLDIYVDGNLVYSDFDFFVDEDKINTMTFATGKNTKSNFYINNFDVTVSPPISNILVNNIPVDNFNSSVNTYTFESSTEFNSNTIVGLITNEYYKSHTVENNYNNDISVITITDILDDKWTYTVHHNYILSANKTKQDLIDFITYINNNYTENEFTENTWAILVDSLIYANEVIADDNSTEETYTLAYQELQASIGTLLTPVVNVNGQTDLINLQIYSSDLLNNYTYEEILENGAYVYNSENNSFSSVPYKYLNAEYLRLPNDYASHGLLKITPMRNISMLVLKDRLSGVFTESGFSYTGDIITSSDGVVYKVYRKDLNTPDQLTLDLMDYITNKNTGIPNILAFIETEKLTDNYFVKEIFNDFIETDNFSQFNTSWQFLNHVGNTGVLPSTTDIKNLTLLNVPGKYLEMHSPGLDSYRGTLKYFAKQNDKFSFRYKILIDPNDPDNTYLRTWLSSGSPLEVDPTNTSITRPNVGVEAYAHATNKSNASTYGLYYRHSANNTIHLITNYSKNIWVDIEFIVDVVNHTFTVRVGPEGETITEYTNTLAGYKFFRNVNDLNCLSFWTRQSGSSLHYFKEVYVTPITRNILSNIKVDGNNVNSFHDLTKAYLYKYTNGDDLNLTRVETTNFSSGTLTKNTGYDALTVTDTNNYNYNYEVYYELNVDKTLLSETIKEAEEVKRYRYTQVTYGDVSIALSNAKLVASSITATQEDVNTATTNLRNAIDALVLISLNVYNYDVKTIIDRNYDDFVNMEVNITPKSAFTANFTFNQEYAGGYTFSGKTHTRTLVTTSILPAGTKITFIDNSTSDYQAYYYIISNEDVLNNKKEIPFTDFIKMGTSTHYVD